MQTDLSNQSTNDPTMFQTKRECKRLHDEHLARTQEEHKAILRSQQIRQRKGQQFQGNEEHDYAVDPKTGLEVLQRVAGKPADNFARIAGQPAHSFVIIVYVGPNPVEDEQSEFSAFFKSLTIGEFFLRVRTGFGCLEKNFQPTDGRREQYTTNTARTELHSMITFHQLQSSGLHTFCVPRTIVIHVSCLIFCTCKARPPLPVNSKS